MKNSWAPKIIICSVVIAVLINIFLPMILAPLANKNEKKPTKGAKNLNFKEQIMHMMVHHNNVPITSTLIVAVVVGLSVSISTLIC